MMSQGATSSLLFVVLKMNPLLVELLQQQRHLFFLLQSLFSLLLSTQQAPSPALKKLLRRFRYQKEFHPTLQKKFLSKAQLTQKQQNRGNLLEYDIFGQTGLWENQFLGLYDKIKTESTKDTN